MNNAFKAGQSGDPLFRDIFEVENLFPASWINAFDESSPSIHVTEESDAFTINVQVHASRKEHFKVDIENDILTIQVFSPLNGCYAFVRSFRLPGNIQQHLITASYKNGLLTLHLPKKVEAKKKEVPVK